MLYTKDGIPFIIPQGQKVGMHLLTQLREKKEPRGYKDKDAKPFFSLEQREKIK